MAEDIYIRPRGQNAGARRTVKIDPAMKVLGHCPHCFNSMGKWACWASEHNKPCKQCGAVKTVCHCDMAEGREHPAHLKGA